MRRIHAFSLPKVLGLYGICLRFREIVKTKGLPHSFYCCLFFNRLLLLVVSISQSDTLKKSFMIANIYNFLRAFHTSLYKIGGYVCRHFVMKQRAYCRFATVIDGDETIKTLCSDMRKDS